MATLKVLSAGATEGPLRELAPEFTSASGHLLDISIGTVGALKQRLLGGEQADFAIVSEPAAQELEAAGVLRAGSALVLGRAATGIAVRDGALMPDISTVPAFEKALRNAQTVAVTDPAYGGSSGTYLTALFEKMGLSEMLAPKLVHGRNGHDVGNLIASGKAEVGLSFTSEFLPIEGVSVVGPLPAEIGFINGYAAAFPAGEVSLAAQALMDFLTSPQAKLRFTAFGLE